MKRPVLAFLPGSLRYFPLPLIAFALAALTPACGGDPPHAALVIYDACAPISIVTSPTITPAQALGVAGGFALWNQRAGTRISSPAPAGGGAATPGDAGADAGPPPAPRVSLVFQPAAPPFHGLYDDQHATIFINDDLVDLHPLEVTVAHELGHVFGLVHIDPAVRSSLMNSGNLTVEPTAQDLQVLAAQWGRCTP